MILNIFGNIESFFNQAINGILTVVNFVLDIFDFLRILVNLIPNPFRNIIFVFLPIFIGFWFWKAYHGGGS